MAKIRYPKLFNRIVLLLLTTLSLGSCHEDDKILFKEGLFLTEEFKYADQGVKLAINISENSSNFDSGKYVHIYIAIILLTILIRSFLKCI